MAMTIDSTADEALQRVAAPSLPEAWTVNASRSAILEIVVSWGDSILHVAHLEPTRRFWVGEVEKPRRKSLRAAMGGGKVDFTVDAAVLGATRLPLVLNEDGKLWFVIPRGAQGELELAGGRIGFDELEAQGLLHSVTRALPAGTGARKHPLARGARAHIDLGALRFSVRWVAAAQAVGFEDRTGVSWSWRGWVLASAAIHAAVLAILHWLPAEPRLLEPVPMANANDQHGTETWLTRGG